jgi:hypothetical protein
MIAEWTEISKNIITGLAIILAGIWTIYRFGINRERYPKLQFDLELNVLGKSKHNYIVELTAVVENKGFTRLRIDEFEFHLLYFDDETKIDTSDVKINNQLKFNYAIRNGQWVKQKHIPFVDGGIVQKYRHVTVLPDSAKYAMIYSKFKDPKKTSIGIYHIEKTFSL